MAEGNPEDAELNPVTPIYNEDNEYEDAFCCDKRTHNRKQNNSCRTSISQLHQSSLHQIENPNIDATAQKFSLGIDSNPNSVTFDACTRAALRLRYLLTQLQDGELPVDVLQKNLGYAIHVLEMISSDKHQSSANEANETEDFAHVETNAIPLEVQEWLSSTFTRQTPNIRHRTDEKLKFRTVAHAIRAGIFVERISRRITNNTVLEFPPNVRKILNTLDEWSFDTFSLNDVAMGSPVKYLGYDLINRYGLVRKFKIPCEKLENFLRKIESGYNRYKNPYHNNLHAADVTQTMHFVLCQIGLMTWLTDLEIFATLIAAIIHDYEHTGTTNNFHVMSGSEIATLYNDRAVLENHHVSASFRILKEKESDILQNLSSEDYRIFRSLVIDMVLATDMSFHFHQLKTMKNLLNHGQLIIDKSKAVSLVLHCCDISHPAKKWSLHHRWTMQLLEEFFRQGDEERILGLPFSPLCDRKNTLVAESQIGFIEFIVEPSMQVCSDMLEIVLGSLKQKDNSDETQNEGSSIQRKKIDKPWIYHLVENKKLWKQQELTDIQPKMRKKYPGKIDVHEPERKG